MSDQCPDVKSEDVVHPCDVHKLRSAFAETQCDVLKSDLFEVLINLCRTETFWRAVDLILHEQI